MVVKIPSPLDLFHLETEMTINNDKIPMANEMTPIILAFAKSL